MAVSVCFAVVLLICKFHLLEQLLTKYRLSVLAMTTFNGHAVVGAIFLIWGMWWAVINATKLFNQKPATYRPRLLLFQFLESLVCASIAFIGMIVQQFALKGPGLHLFDEKKHQWVDLKRWHHSTMYLFYFISSLSGMLMHSPFRLPLGLDHLLLSLALFNEGMIFFSHHPTAVTPLDQHVHTLLLIPVFSSALCLLLEVRFRDRLILTLFRISMFLTQGTWFWQIGFVLYPPRGAPIWDQNDHESIMFLTICFSWHYLVNIFLLSIIYGIVYCLLNRRRKYKGTNIETQPLQQESKAYVVLPFECAED